MMPLCPRVCVLVGEVRLKHVHIVMRLHPTAIVSVCDSSYSSDSLDISYKLIVGGKR